MSIKKKLRDMLSRNRATRGWFVRFCARHTMRLFVLQKYLGLEDFQARKRAALWKKFMALMDRTNLEKVVLREGRATFHYMDGCAFHAATAQTSLSSGQYSYGEYEPHETALMAKMVNSGWTVIDAGANFGWHAIHLAKAVGSNGRVVAFEPIPDTFKELLDNKALNGAETIEAHHLALGNETGKVVFFLPDIESGAGAASQFLDMGAKVEVTMVRLDDFAAEQGLDHVEFIKADVEGGELNLLRGAEQLLLRCKPLLFLEVVDIHCARFGNSPQDLFQFLGERGYHGQWLDEQGRLVEVDPAFLPNGNYLFQAR